MWAGPWLRDVAGLDRIGVANYLMAMAVAFLVGILLSGAVADWFVRRGVDLLTVMLGFLALFFCSQLAIVLEWTAPNLLMWVVFGMTGQVAVLAYPWLSSYFGAALSGRANTAVNLVLFLTAFCAQYAIGAIIDLFPTDRAGGYDPRGYQVGFGVFLVAQLLALVWYLLGGVRCWPRRDRRVDQLAWPPPRGPAARLACTAVGLSGVLCAPAWQSIKLRSRRARFWSVNRDRPSLIFRAWCERRRHVAFARHVGASSNFWYSLRRS